MNPQVNDNSPCLEDLLKVTPKTTQRDVEYEVKSASGTLQKSFSDEAIQLMENKSSQVKLNHEINRRSDLKKDNKFIEDRPSTEDVLKKLSICKKNIHSGNEDKLNQN